jgi:hypothetical protein
MRPGASPTERFTAWYAKSIEKLKELPEGDGAFAALMIALPLYERYIIAKLKLDGNPTGDEDVRREISNDLNLDDRHRSIFWGMVRTGFMHQAMVTAGATKWLVSHHFSEFPEFRSFEGQEVLCLDPWKFADRVINLFLHDPRLITASDSFPLADVFALPADALSSAIGGRDTHG